MAKLWTTKEVRIMREIYPVSGVPGVQLAGIKRSATAIAQYARTELKIKSGIRGRTAKVVTLDGITDHLKAHAARLGINADTVYSRIAKSGWTPIKALKTPPGKYDMTGKRARP